MAEQPHDDGFRELQLGGKQLVFLFMAATVVSVVIFLCGVLVGRGVRAERSGIESSVEASAAEPVLAPQVAPASVPAVPAGSDPTQAAPPPEASEFTYFDRLGDAKETPEPLAQAGKVAVAAPAPVIEPDRRPSRTGASTVAAPSATAAMAGGRPPAPEGKPSPAVSPSPEPSTDAASTERGYVVQVAALNARADADVVAKRLSEKGYAAYVVSPAGGTATVFRVRIGSFKSRREAEAMASKLEKEEQFKPWVTL